MSEMMYNYTSSNRKETAAMVLVTPLQPLLKPVKEAWHMLYSTPVFPQDLENYAPWVTTYGLLAPYGECQCGCRKFAPVSNWSRPSRGIRRGDPQRYLFRHKKGGDTRGAPGEPASLKEEFLSKVTVGDRDECWLWQGGNMIKGYGRVWFRGKLQRAHRISYELHCGTIPDGMYVCHRCDVRNCVNPAHLFLGTAQDNTNDMMAKNRMNPPLGERAFKAKLREEDVRQIRLRAQRGESISDLAREFSVYPQSIDYAVKRKSWKHVE